MAIFEETTNTLSSSIYEIETDDGYLLMEEGCTLYILAEDGSRILLEDAIPIPVCH